MIVAGVDISLRRGQTLALLDGDVGAAAVETVRGGGPAAEIAALVARVKEAGAAVVAVDSPLRPSQLLLRREEHRRAYGVPDRRGLNGPLYANYRVCDFELIRRGLPLYQVAAEEATVAGWMRVGFALARALECAGHRLPRDARDHDATLLEVFPDAAFVALLGARPPKKTLPAGADVRRRLLARAGIAVEPTWTHDELDAIAAALTALRWRQGEGCAVGHPTEGLIVLPVRRDALPERYGRLPVEKPA